MSGQTKPPLPRLTRAPGLQGQSACGRRVFDNTKSTNRYNIILKSAGGFINIDKFFKILILLLVGSLVSCCSSRIIDTAPPPSQSSVFQDPACQNVKIRLKIQGTDGFLVFEEVAYVIDIGTPVAERPVLVFLRLLDQDGFSIHEELAGSVAANFTGTLKGSCRLRREISTRIAGAEICIRCFTLPK